MIATPTIIPADYGRDQPTLSKKNRRWGLNPGRDAIRARDDAFDAAARGRVVVTPKELTLVKVSTGGTLPLDRRTRRRLRGAMIDGLSSTSVAR